MSEKRCLIWRPLGINICLRLIIIRGCLDCLKPTNTAWTLLIYFQPCGGFVVIVCNRDGVLHCIGKMHSPRGSSRRLLIPFSTLARLKPLPINSNVWSSFSSKQTTMMTASDYYHRPKTRWSGRRMGKASFRADGKTPKQAQLYERRFLSIRILV